MSKLIPQMVKTWLASVCVVFLTTFAAHSEVLVGKLGHVRDGDTFSMCDEYKCTNIRLCGIDSPELGTSMGEAATQALTNLLKNKSITCVVVGSGTVCDGRSATVSRDRYVAQCKVDGRDVAKFLVDAGHACDWIRFSNGYYSRNNRACRK